jgi:hypothetical protein
MRIVGHIVELAATAGSVAGLRGFTEQPRFRPLARIGPVQVRQYRPRLAAEVALPGEEIAARKRGFRLLAAYIFGANRGRARIVMAAPVAQAPDLPPRPERIAMTAPVAQAWDEAGAWRIRFFMPASATRESLPEPNDPAVRIITVPAQTVAVLRFSGPPTPAAVAAARAALLAALAGGAWTPVGTSTAWFYDPPWTIPRLRRNEVAVVVERRGG